jgi:glycosyltransferase involved in cell wall biosynthesis
VKLAIVVQRYGADINGGAELHARYVAEHLAPHVQVTVLTTCARDYVTWRDEYPAGVEIINGIPVQRFPVAHERDVRVFDRWSHQTFTKTHSYLDELRWLDAQGPASTQLIRHIKANHAGYDYFLFFSYRYYHAYHGARAVPAKAILVPTAERDPAIGLSIFHPIFRGVRAVMYNSHEEQRMIHAASANQDVPGVVVGIGSDIPRSSQADRFRQKYSIAGRFALYIGRIDPNKGCKELFTYFLQGLPSLPKGLSLVLIGKEILPIPQHPRIRHLGFLEDADKFDALAAADLLIMPSYYESLSMVALEAWALGRPVLANGHCEVLRGQCIRSRAGLYYETQAEFVETLKAIADGRTLNAALGANGRTFFDRHYAWPVIERKYLDMLDRLSRDETREGHLPRPERSRGQTDLKEPGFLAKRKRILAPANDVLAGLPSGPVIDHSPAEADHGPAKADHSPAKAGHYVQGDHAAVS